MIEKRKDGADGHVKSANALQATLVELQALQLQTRQAHWNVSGALYWPLHQMLDEHNAGIARMGDLVAERLLAIGSSADGRPRTILEDADLPEIAGGFVTDAWCLKFFSEQYGTVGERLHERITEVEDEDPTSANLLQEVEHLVEKDQWQMHAHLRRPAATGSEGANAGALGKVAARRTSPTHRTGAKG